MAEMNYANGMKAALALGRALLAIREDHAFHAQVAQANPWFTPYYIRESISNVLPWFDSAELDRVAGVANRARHGIKGANIGLIMAGNLPLVGLQDLLFVWLSGHRAVIKLSHKDNLLLPRALELAADIFPEIKRLYDFDLKAERLDYLIATGSDNTARYIEHYFSEIPKTIRKNRFSVGILRGKPSAEQMDSLCRDILMYNGMGCRNISLILLGDRYQLHQLELAMNRYPEELIAGSYRDLVQWERATAQTQQRKFRDFKWVLVNEVEDFEPAPPGWLNVLEFTEKQGPNAWIAAHHEQLQCSYFDFGKSQRPKLADYPDNVAIPAILAGVRPRQKG